VRLVVDTNVVGVDPPLSGNAMLRLLDASRRGTVNLIVCELVRAEAANGWAHRVDEQFRQERRTQQSLARLGVERPVQSTSTVAELREQQRKRIDETLKSAGATSAPLPSSAHDVVVLRALDRRPPFDSEGKDGYRDSLLWETVLELAIREPVVFVSRDVRAYFNGAKEKGLHRLLVDEARQRCGREDAVRLFFDLDAAVDFTVAGTAVEQAQAAQVEADRDAKQSLTRALRAPTFEARIIEAMRHAVGWEDLSWQDITPLLPHRATAWVSLDEIEDVTDIQVVGARRLSDTITANLSARLLISIEIHLPASDAETIDEDDALVYAGTGEPLEMVKATALRTVRGHFEATFNVGNSSLRNIRLRRFTHSRV
jgi:hypothetical protein